MHKNTKQSPVVVEFSKGAKVFVDPGIPTTPVHPDLREGPPPTQVRLADGTLVELPSDQMLFSEQTKSGTSRVGLGGMSFEGTSDEGKLLFWRVLDLLPEENIAWNRIDRIALDPRQVSQVLVDGRVVWKFSAEN